MTSVPADLCSCSKLRENHDDKALTFGALVFSDRAGVRTAEAVPLRGAALRDAFGVGTPDAFSCSD